MSLLHMADSMPFFADFVGHMHTIHDFIFKIPMHQSKPFEKSIIDFTIPKTIRNVVILIF